MSNFGDAPMHWVSNSFQDGNERDGQWEDSFNGQKMELTIQQGQTTKVVLDGVDQPEICGAVQDAVVASKIEGGKMLANVKGHRLEFHRVGPAPCSTDDEKSATREDHKSNQRARTTLTGNDDNGTDAPSDVLQVHSSNSSDYYNNSRSNTPRRTKIHAKTDDGVEDPHEERRTQRSHTHDGVEERRKTGTPGMDFADRLDSRRNKRTRTSSGDIGRQNGRKSGHRTPRRGSRKQRSSTVDQIEHRNGRNGRQHDSSGHASGHGGYRSPVQGYNPYEEPPNPRSEDELAQTSDEYDMPDDPFNAATPTRESNAFGGSGGRRHSPARRLGGRRLSAAGRRGHSAVGRRHRDRDERPMKTGPVGVAAQGSSSVGVAQRNRTIRFPHMNLERDGAGFQAALMSLLRDRGVQVLSCREGSLIVPLRCAEKDIDMLHRIIADLESGMLEVPGYKTRDAHEVPNGYGIQSTEFDKLKAKGGKAADERLVTEVKKVNFAEMAAKELLLQKGFQACEGELAGLQNSLTAFAERHELSIPADVMPLFVIIGAENAGKSTLMGTLAGKSIVFVSHGTGTRCFLKYHLEKNRVSKIEVRENYKPRKFKNLPALHRYLEKKMKDIEATCKGGMSNEMIDIVIHGPDVRNMLAVDTPGVAPGEISKHKQVVRILKNLFRKKNAVPIIVRSHVDATANDTTTQLLMEQIFQEPDFLEKRRPLTIANKFDKGGRQLMHEGAAMAQEKIEGTWRASGVTFDKRTKCCTPVHDNSKMYPTFLTVLKKGADEKSESEMSHEELNRFYENRPFVEQQWWEKHCQILKEMHIEVNGETVRVWDYVGSSKLAEKMHERKMENVSQLKTHVVCEIEKKLQELIVNATDHADDYPDFQSFSPRKQSIVLKELKLKFESYREKFIESFVLCSTNPSVKYPNHKYGLTIDEENKLLKDYLRENPDLDVVNGQTGRTISMYDKIKDAYDKIESNAWEGNSRDQPKWLRLFLDAQYLREGFQEVLSHLPGVHKKMSANRIDENDDGKENDELDCHGRIFATASIHRTKEMFTFILSTIEPVKCKSDELMDRMKAGVDGGLCGISAPALQYSVNKNMDRIIYPTTLFFYRTAFIYDRIADAVKEVLSQDVKYEEFAKLYGPILDTIVHNPTKKIIKSLAHEAVAHITAYSHELQSSGLNPISVLSVLEEVGQTLGLDARFKPYEKISKADIGSVVAGPPPVNGNPRYRCTQLCDSLVVEAAMKSVRDANKHKAFSYGAWLKFDGEDDTKPLHEPYVAMMDCADGPHGAKAYRCVLGVFPNGSSEIELYSVGLVHTGKSKKVKLVKEADQLSRRNFEITLDYVVQTAHQSKTCIPEFVSFNERLERIKSGNGAHKSLTVTPRPAPAKSYMDLFSQQPAAAQVPVQTEHMVTRILNETVPRNDMDKVLLEAPNPLPDHLIVHKRVGDSLMELVIDPITSGAGRKQEGVQAMVEKKKQKMDSFSSIRCVTQMDWDVKRPLLVMRIQDIFQRYIAKFLQRRIDDNATTDIWNLLRRGEADYCNEMFFKPALARYAKTYSVGTDNRIEVQRRIQMVLEELHCKDTTTDSITIDTIKQVQAKRRSPEEAAKLEEANLRLNEFLTDRKALYSAIVNIGQSMEPPDYPDDDSDNSQSDSS